jgi:hypothetical protein
VDVGSRAPGGGARRRASIIRGNRSHEVGHLDGDVTDEKGAIVTWKVEMTSPAYLVRAGWKSTTLKQGDEVKVTVRPLRDGSPGGLFVSVTLADGRSFTEKPAIPPGK